MTKTKPARPNCYHLIVTLSKERSLLSFLFWREEEKFFRGTRGSHKPHLHYISIWGKITSICSHGLSIALRAPRKWPNPHSSAFSLPRWTSPQHPVKPEVWKIMPESKQYFLYSGTMEKSYSTSLFLLDTKVQKKKEPTTWSVMFWALPSTLSKHWWHRKLPSERTHFQVFLVNELRKEAMIQINIVHEYRRTGQCKGNTLGRGSQWGGIWEAERNFLVQIWCP